MLRGPEACHRSGINAVRLSPTGKHLFTASRDGTIRCWGLGRKGCTHERVFDEHVDWVNDILLCHEGSAPSSRTDADGPSGFRVPATRGRESHDHSDPACLSIPRHIDAGAHQSHVLHSRAYAQIHVHVRVCAHKGTH